jgi:hypothetical protein
MNRYLYFRIASDRSAIGLEDVDARKEVDVPVVTMGGGRQGGLVALLKYKQEDVECLVCSWVLHGVVVGRGRSSVRSGSLNGQVNDATEVELAARRGSGEP